MNKIEYEPVQTSALYRSAVYYVRRRIAPAIVALVVLWIATAVGRVWVAHTVLGNRIDQGTIADTDAPMLNRKLFWSRSVGPLLKCPWKQVILYYPNGYASSNSVKVF